MSLRLELRLTILFLARTLCRREKGFRKSLFLRPIKVNEANVICFSNVEIDDPWIIPVKNALPPRPCKQDSSVQKFFMACGYWCPS